MKSFASLLFGLDDPGSQQRAASAQLPSMLAVSKFEHWIPSMPTPSESDRILLGVAVWSGYDLELLDRLQATLEERQPRHLIYVFDIDEYQNAEDLERCVPGIGRVYQTPVVGIWRNGVLTSSAWGAKGRELVALTVRLE